jgi:UDP-N-acetylmuramate: L-alanyl-gamma-D-glutamyl-meso-diaminopimelate ligase
VARSDGLAIADLVDAFGRFEGVHRRQEELGTGDGVTVVDDFAHHPTAVGETIPALAERYRGRRLVVVFEPRSLTAGRRMFFDAYRRALAEADAVYFAPLFHSRRLSAEEALDLDALVAALEHDGRVSAKADSVDELRALVLAAVEPGDVVVTMSSGSFEGLPHRLLADLQRRQS